MAGAVARRARGLRKPFGPAVFRAIPGVEAKVHEVTQRWGRRRVAVLLGSSTGGIAETEAAFRFHKKHQTLPESYRISTQHALSALATLCARYFGLKGPHFVCSTACSSSAKVFASAQRLIGAGFADAALVGGVDTLCDMTLNGFASLGILSDELCRPFGLNRKGINIGEGGGLCVLERRSPETVATKETSKEDKSQVRAEKQCCFWAPRIVRRVPPFVASARWQGAERAMRQALSAAESA